PCDPPRNIGAYSVEAPPINKDPAPPRRVLRLPQNVGAVIDAVEVDWLAIVVFPFAVGRRSDTRHRSQRRPAVDMRHHLAVHGAGGNVARPPHDGRYAPAAFEGPALLTAEPRGSRLPITLHP